MQDVFNKIISCEKKFTYKKEYQEFKKLNFQYLNVEVLRKHVLKISSNSEVNASEKLEDLEEMVPHC